MKFKKCKTVEEFIGLWVQMDCIVHHLRDKNQVKYWEKYCVLNDEHDDNSFIVDSKTGKKRLINRKDAIENPFLFIDMFKKMMKIAEKGVSSDSMYEVFLNAIYDSIGD